MGDSISAQPENQSHMPAVLSRNCPLPAAHLWARAAHQLSATDAAGLSLAHGIAELKQVLQNKGPKTMSELVKLHKINKDIIWRAGKTGEILDDAAVREANRYVALYYLEERQLERRVDREVYVPRSTIKDNEKKTITEYLELHRRESFIHLGNAERETSLTLTGNSTISTRRRDCLLGLARQRGIEVRDGFDETVPLIGSRLWWTHHLNELVKNVEDVLMTLPPSRRPETEGNVQFWGERPAQLRFG